jgi:hypothetical protein
MVAWATAPRVEGNEFRGYNWLLKWWSNSGLEVLAGKDLNGRIPNPAQQTIGPVWLVWVIVDEHEPLCSCVRQVQQIVMVPTQGFFFAPCCCAAAGGKIARYAAAASVVFTK